jgi:mRNA-degrading endonuclease toxin of MazEF toxin-antitoxin module
MEARLSSLARDSVANVSQIIAVDRQLLTELVARLPTPSLERILAGIDIVLDR